MKTVARFVTRLQGEGDGMFIGTMFKGNENTFKPNTVYEIREILGVLTIVEIGQGVGAGDNNCVSAYMSEGKTPFHWGSHIGNIIESYSKVMFLTMNEYLQRLEFFNSIKEDD